MTCHSSFDLLPCELAAAIFGNHRANCKPPVARRLFGAKRDQTSFFFALPGFPASTPPLQVHTNSVPASTTSLRALRTCMEETGVSASSWNLPCICICKKEKHAHQMRRRCAAHAREGRTSVTCTSAGLIRRDDNNGPA
jgi:hypothetical protein